MKLLKQDLLTLLISLFIFTGCQNPDSIGLDVNPEDAIQGNLIDTISVRSMTVKEDSIFTGAATKYPVGILKDPILGNTNADLSITFTLPSDNLTFGTSPVLDSAVLVLNYSDEYTGDLNSRLQFEVYQLGERLTITSNYFSNAEHVASSGLIGTKSVRVNIKDSLTVRELVKGGPDVNKKNAPQVRIPINAAFINQNFLNAAATNFASSNAFGDFFKGLQVRVNENLTTGLGGLASVNLANANSRLEIYYKSQNGTAVDTTLSSFPINTSNSAATVRHNYTPAVQAQLNAPSNTYAQNFVQPLGGLKTKVNFPFIQNVKTLGNITVNKAELVVQIETGSDVFSPSPRLYMYRTDIAGQRQLLPDEVLGLSENSLGGFYDSTKKQYKFTLTAYIQDLLSDKLVQYDTFITADKPQRTATNVIAPSISSVSRAVLVAAGSTSPMKMKLNLVYTKVN